MHKYSYLRVESMGDDDCDDGDAAVVPAARSQSETETSIIFSSRRVEIKVLSEGGTGGLRLWLRLIAADETSG